MTGLVKQELDTWLDKVNYAELNSDLYLPSEFALTFMNFIKLVNGDTGESNKTPPFHLKMLDKLTETKSKYIVNVVFRGAAKTTVFMEYLTLYIAVFGSLPNMGDITGMIYVSDSIDNGVKSARKNIEHRWNSSSYLQHWLPKAGVKFNDNYLEFTNIQGHKLGVKMFGAQSGIRGTKVFGKRPTLAILDDLMSDADGKSKTTMENIKDTIYKGVMPALDTDNRKIIFNGTPFNKEDILIEAVESGAWNVNVWPVCERFPCSREEFVGAWEDRFSYDFINEQYNLANSTGHLAAFNQEYMLRISSEDERLVNNNDIQWYSRRVLLDKKDSFNFYITTDFATSAKDTADYSVISVWAYNSNGDWYWVDGMCEKTTMDKSIDKLFLLAQKYKPQSVGIEVTGQQGAFIQWIQREMMVRNNYFNLARDSKGNTGIRPTTDKLSRFNLVVPWFKAKKMFFPEEWKDKEIIKIFMDQIKLATFSGIKGKDDCIDTISMLGFINAWRPSDELSYSEDKALWEDDDEFTNQSNEVSRLSSYIV